MVCAYFTVKNTADRSGGQVYGHWQTGVMVYTALLNTILLQLAVLIEHWTMVHVAMLGGSIGKPRSAVSSGSWSRLTVAVWVVCFSFLAC